MGWLQIILYNSIEVFFTLLREVGLHLSIALESKLSSLCIRFALTFAQNKQLRHNNAIQM